MRWMIWRAMFPRLYLHAADRAAEALAHHVAAQPQRLEDLRSLVVAPQVEIQSQV